MVMNKKEQSEMDELRKQLYIARALRFTEFVEKDVSPDDWSKLTIGWTYNAYNGKVSESCSTTNYHAIGRTDKTNTQRGIEMYSTELLAYKALRYEMEQKFANELSEIDKKIDELKKR
jgi:hypothetical protein